MKVLLALLLLAPLLAAAQQPTVHLQSRVTGNRELPRVTYILPWRQPGEVDFSWEPEPGIAEELFQPLRRDEYRRQLNYQKHLTASAGVGSQSIPDQQEERGN